MTDYAKHEIRWGIIGCGDVTEIKSGPAFNKVSNSKLIAVMRRDAAKAKDYAARHNVPNWYAHADDLINDPDVNAIYIATPPDSHEEYTLKALNAGKPVYVEKPMSVNAKASQNMADCAVSTGQKLSVAHYRRQQPLFLKIKELIDSGAIGQVQLINMRQLIPAANFNLSNERVLWRVNPTIAGGGIFHDLAPHQLDLMLYFFGQPRHVTGVATNQAGLYDADDTVSASILFQNNIVFNGLWSFCAPEKMKTEYCEIIGSTGTIKFSVFDRFEINLKQAGQEDQLITFAPLQHVQQPMIEKVVQYFLDKADNPCPASDGVTVMQMIDAITNKGF